MKTSKNNVPNINLKRFRPTTNDKGELVLECIVHGEVSVISPTPDSFFFAAVMHDTLVEH